MISGYQIGSWHAILRLLSGTKKEENQSFDNINILLITSTILMVFSCVMEVLMYFLYNNKVEDNTDKYSNTDINIFNLHLQFQSRKEIVALWQSQRRKARWKMAKVNMSESLKLRHATEFSGYYKKENSNNEERVLSEIEIAKTSDNLDSWDETWTRGHRHWRRKVNSLKFYNYLDIFFGSNRSPRRGNVVCLCMRACVTFLK